MVDKEEIIRRKMARSQARIEEERRRMRSYGGQLTSEARVTDRDRKIQIGAWMLSRAEAHYPGITEKMLEDLRSFYLVTDYHRALFKLPPLPEAERKIRLANIAEARRRKAKPKDKPNGGVNPADVTVAPLTAKDDGGTGTPDGDA